MQQLCVSLGVLALAPSAALAHIAEKKICLEGQMKTVRGDYLAVHGAVATRNGQSTGCHIQPQSLSNLLAQRLSSATWVLLFPDLQ